MVATDRKINNELLSFPMRGANLRVPATGTGGYLSTQKVLQRHDICSFIL